MNPRAERGSVTVFFTIAAAGLLVMIGLIVDGGAKITLAQRADNLSAQAARAAGQAAQPANLITGSTANVDRARAVRAAEAFLTANHATGTVTLDPDRQGLTVTLTLTSPTVFLGLVGVRDVTATGTSHARLVHAVNGVRP